MILIVETWGGACCCVILYTTNLAWKTGLGLNLGFCGDRLLNNLYVLFVCLQNEDDDLYKRDFSAATLEDHFDKTILPKVMQVKNFGRSGRTKYTHLVDQDTTQFDSPWISETAQNLKFHNNQAAGMKQVFERPSVKRSK